MALANIDAVIELIKNSPSAADARQALDKRWHAPALFELLERVGSDAADQNPQRGLWLSGDLYRLTEEQAQAILEIRLHRLTAMEQSKLMEDYQGVLDEIADLLDILGSTSA